MANTYDGATGDTSKGRPIKGQLGSQPDVAGIPGGPDVDVNAKKVKRVKKGEFNMDVQEPGETQNSSQLNS